MSNGDDDVEGSGSGPDAPRSFVDMDDAEVRDTAHALARDITDHFLELVGREQVVAYTEQLSVDLGSYIIRRIQVRFGLSEEQLCRVLEIRVSVGVVDGSTSRTYNLTATGRPLSVIDQSTKEFIDGCLSDLASTSTFEVHSTGSAAGDAWVRQKVTMLGEIGTYIFRAITTFKLRQPLSVRLAEVEGQLRVRDALIASLRAEIDALTARLAEARSVQ